MGRRRHCARTWAWTEPYASHEGGFADFLARQPL
jgi:hypothetical protein